MMVLKDQKYLSFAEAVVCVIALAISAMILRQALPFLYDNVLTYPLITVILFGAVTLVVIKIKELEKEYLFPRNKYGKSLAPMLFFTIAFFLISRLAIDLEDIVRLGLRKFLESRGEWIYNLSARKGVHFLTIVLVAPIMEEILFRGVFFRSFLKHYSVKLSIILSTLLFAVLHTNAAGSFFSGFGSSLLSGAFFAWIVLKTDNIKIAIGCHVLWNLLNYILPFLMMLVSAKVRGIDDLMLVMTTLVLTAFLCFYLGYRGIKN
jgi:membrane protease YdiL (CAAX protease family)